MHPDQLDVPLRASQLMRRPVRDHTGKVLGRIADLHTTRDAGGRERVTAAVVTARRWGRLLGYERDEIAGPWLLEKIARYVLRRRTRQVPLDDLQF